MEHRGSGLPEGLEPLRDSALKGPAVTQPLCDLLITGGAGETLEGKVDIVGIGRPG